MGIQGMAIEDWGRLSQSSFDLELNFTAPNGETATIKGIGTSNQITIQTDGQDVIGKNVHISFSENVLLTENPNYPVRNENDVVSMHDHLVSFNDSRGTLKNYQIKQTYPDQTVGIIACDCDDYKTHPLAPSDIVISNITEVGFDIAFTSNSNNIETGFVIEIDTDPNYSNPITITTGQGVVTATFDSGEASTEYFVQAKATGDIDSGYSESVSETTDSGTVLFDPTDLPTLYAWYDLQLLDWKTSVAQDYVTLNGSNISEVEIKSGDQGNLEQLTLSKQPQIGTDENGKRYISNINGDLLQGHVLITQPFTFFIPIDVKSISALSSGFFINTPTGLIQIFHQINASLTINRGGSFSTSPGALTVGKHLIACVFNGANSEIRIDGVLIATGSVSIVFTEINTEYYLSGTANGTFGTDTNQYGMSIHGLLNESDMLRMEGFFEHRLDLDCLEAGHIYKDNPPEI